MSHTILAVSMRQATLKSRFGDWSDSQECVKFIEIVIGDVYRERGYFRIVVADEYLRHAEICGYPECRCS